MSARSNREDASTRTESIVDAHDCDWMVGDGDQGRCRCGLMVTTEDEWRRHTERAVIDQMWSPAAEVISSVAALEGLPERSVIAVRPATENAVFRRIALGDPGLNAWCNLTGTFRSTPGLLPAIVLERGPEALPAENPAEVSRDVVPAKETMRMKQSDDDTDASVDEGVPPVIIQDGPLDLGGLRNMPAPDVAAGIADIESGEG